MDQRILDFEKQYLKPKLPDIHPGDTVRVHQRIEEAGKTRIHQFEGTVIAMQHGKGMGGSFTVRKIGAQGVGVETTFFWHAPTLFKVERIKSGDVRRAKLYYLRNLTARAARKLKGAHVGDVWEEEAVKEAVKEEQAAQAEETKEEKSEGSPKMKGETKDEKTDQAAGKDGGTAGSRVPEEARVPDSGSEPKP